MNEVGWCYFEGFGTKKDKVSQSVSVTPPPLEPLQERPMACPSRLVGKPPQIVSPKVHFDAAKSGTRTLGINGLSQRDESQSTDHQLTRFTPFAIYHIRLAG